MRGTTIEYYDSHAEDFVSSTVGADMGTLLAAFLELVPDGGEGARLGLRIRARLPGDDAGGV